ncbi:hypothetical protein [Bacteroides sp. 51]|uniref:hypothetical protein n=1 Tax=Bacteroides sp. 51 TaxID=2302938 RepID=UPI0013D0A53F|nr:hypothetical protein [Bacteroides sp. 51]
MKYIFKLLVAVLCCTFVGCDNDEWGNGDPAMEHVYYFGFENWGDKNNFNNNKVQYNVDQGSTIEIPVQFHSERIRSYDVVVYYYVSTGASDLKRGVDYQIVDDKGTVLEPGADNAFSMTFSQAKKDVKNIYVKALNVNKGSFDVLTFDPVAGEISHPDNIVNSQTKDYEVRAFTKNYKVKVNVK